MIDRQGRVKLLDFGLARDNSQNRLTPTGNILGTPRYLAPERIQAPSLKPSASVDQYSLGIMYFEMLVGNPPFASEDVTALLQEQLVGQPPSLQELRPGLPVGLCRIVTRMLAKYPAQRWTNLQQIETLLNSKNFVQGMCEDIGDDTIDFKSPQ